MFFQHLFFGAKMGDGVVNQLINDLSYHHPIAAILHALKQLVDQINQTLMLLIHQCHTGVVRIIPLKHLTSVVFLHRWR